MPAPFIHQGNIIRHRSREFSRTRYSEWLQDIRQRADRVVAGESRGDPWPVVRKRLESCLKKKMTDRVSIEPEAERALFAALDWYQIQRGDMGIEFLDAFWTVPGVLSTNPGIARTISISSDGTPIRQFPMDR